MSNKSDSQSPSSALQQIAVAFRLIGWLSFWTQLVLGVVSTIVLLFASLSRDVGPANQRSPGTGFGIVLAVSGVITLGLAIYLAFR